MRGIPGGGEAAQRLLKVPTEGNDVQHACYACSLLAFLELLWAMTAESLAWHFWRTGTRRL